MNRINYLRKTRKMSIQDLSNAIGFSRPFISFMESGRRNISTEASRRLSAFFSVTDKFLLGADTAGIIAYVWTAEDELLKRNKNIVYLTKEEYESLKADGALHETEQPAILQIYSGVTRQYDGLNSFIQREITRNSNSELAETISIRTEINGLIERMDKAQLDKVFLLLKEVVLK